MSRRGPHAGRGRREAAFTVVELIVAVTLMMILVGSATTVLAGSDAAQTRAKVRSKQAAIAEAIFERVAAGRDWARSPACSTSPYTGCSGYLTTRFSSDPLLRDETSGLQFTVAITAQAVDSPSDLQGPDDTDGVLPDYYQIRVRVNPTANVPGVKPVTTGGTVNPPARISTGSVSVRMCKAFRQADERIALATCGSGAPDSIRLAPPTNCSGTYDCTPYNRAAADDPNYFTRISLTPAGGVTFSLLGPSPSTAVARTGTTDSEGRAKAIGLTPGQYQLVVGAPPAGYVPWTSHSVPTSGMATVEAGRSSDVLQVFQPVGPASYRLYATTRDVTNPWSPVDYPYAIRRIVFKLIPAPYGRVPFARNWTVINSGGAYGDVIRPSPGLYAMAVLRAPGARVSRIEANPGPPNDYIWIDPQGGTKGTRPYSARIRMTYCEPARRQALIDRYCHWANTCWFSIGGVRKFLRPCGGDTQLEGGTLGAGGT